MQIFWLLSNPCLAQGQTFRIELTDVVLVYKNYFNNLSSHEYTSNLIPLLEELKHAAIIPCSGAAPTPEECLMA